MVVLVYQITLSLSRNSEKIGKLYYRDLLFRKFLLQFIHRRS